MDQLLELFHSDHDGDIMDVDLQMIPPWLVVSLYSKMYIVSMVLFHNDGGYNVGVTNCMSHFYMVVPTKANVKLANGNMVNAQGIWIILCCFPNFFIIILSLKTASVIP